MAESTTERIALEVRAKVKSLDALKAAEQHLEQLIKLRNEVNGGKVKVRVDGGGKAVDDLQKKIQTLAAQLKAVGQTQVGKAVASDVNQVAIAYNRAKNKVAELQGQLSNLQQARKGRPNAKLDPQIAKVQQQLGAYQKIIASASEVQAALTPGAKDFAKAEGQVGSAAQQGTKQLAEQTKVLNEKKAAFAKTEKAAKDFTKAEEQQAKATQKNAAATKKAEKGLLRRTTGGKSQSETFSVSPGVTRTVRTSGGKSTSQTTENFEQQIKLIRQKQAAESAAAKRAATNDKQRKAALEREAVQLERLAEATRKKGLDDTKLYQDLTGAAKKARGEIAKLEAQIDRAAKKATKADALNTSGRLKNNIVEKGKDQRAVIIKDSQALARSYEQEAKALRGLQNSMRSVGLEGETRFEQVANAARKAEREAAKLRRAMAQQQQDDAKRRAFAQSVERQRDDLLKQGFHAQNDRTVKRADGTARRETTLVRDQGNLREVSKAIVELDSNGKALNATFETTKRQLKEVGNRANWATRNFIENTKVVVSWAASVIAYQAAFRAIGATKDAVIELQRSSAVLTAVFQGERQEAVRLKDDLLDLAVAQGLTGKEALDAGIRFSRLGLTRKQVLEAVTVSLKAANVAEIEAGVAAEQLSAIMASFNLEVSQLYQVLTRLNNVSNQYNTTNKDLLEGIARVGNLAKESGLALEELIATVATGTGLTGRSGAEFGNAIKSIIVSLSNPEIQGKLDNLFDFDVTSQTGEIKTMDNLLKDLAVTYQDLTQAQKQELLQIVGKKQQASRLAVILQNYTTIQRNLVASLRDGTATEEENRDIRATLLSQLTSLRTAYEKLAVSSTGAFNDGIIGSGASTIIRFLTTLIEILEKGSGLFPILAAAAGLFFFRFIRGAIALANTRQQAGLLMNTLTKMKDIWSDLNKIMIMQERQISRNNKAYGRLVSRLYAVGNSGIFGGRAMMFFGRALLFTVGNIAKLAGGIVVMTLIFQALEKASDAWERYREAQEAARREALGFSKDLNRLADTVKRLGAIRDTAEFLRDIATTAKQGDLSRMVNDLIAIGNVDPTEAERIRDLVSSGDRKTLQTELNRIVAETAEEQLAQIDNQIVELTNDLRAQEDQLAATRKEKEQYEDTFLRRVGLGRSMSDINNDIKEQQDEFNKLTNQLNQARNEARQLRGALHTALIDEGQIEATVQAFGDQSKAIADLISRDGTLGEAIAKAMSLGIANAADDTYLAEIRGQFETTINGLSAQLEEALGGGAVNAFRSQRAGIAEETRQLQAAFDKAKADLNAEEAKRGSFFGADEGRLAVLRKDFAAAQDALDAQKQREAAFVRENQAINERAKIAGKLEADLDTEQKRLAAVTSNYNQLTAARREDNRIAREQLDLAVTYAKRQLELQRVRSDAAANLQRFGAGRDASDRLLNFQESVRRQLDDSLSRIQQLRTLAEQAIPGSDLAESTGESLQDEMARAAAMADALEQSRNQIIARRAIIEKEILEARIKQNEEASKALGLASREEQLRASFLSRFESENGGNRLSENQFQFLDQQTRQAVNSFTPQLAPESQGSEVARLERELERLANSDQVIEGLERSIDSYTDAIIQAIEAVARTGIRTPSPVADDSLTRNDTGNTTINIQVADNGINLGLGSSVNTIADRLSEVVNDRLTSEIAAVNQRIDSFLLESQSASSRGASV